MEGNFWLVPGFLHGLTLFTRLDTSPICNSKGPSIEDDRTKLSKMDPSPLYAYLNLPPVCADTILLRKIFWQQKLWDTFKEPSSH